MQFGIVRNPYALDHTTGGSSGGPAASTAANLGAHFAVKHLLTICCMLPDSGWLPPGGLLVCMLYMSHGFMISCLLKRIALQL